MKSSNFQATIRAMDTIDTFVREKVPGNPSVKRFMVAGESKVILYIILI